MTGESSGITRGLSDRVNDVGWDAVDVGGEK